MTLDDLRARDDWETLERWLYKSKYGKLCDRTGMSREEARAARMMWRAQGGAVRHGKAGTTAATPKRTQREEVQTGLDASMGPRLEGADGRPSREDLCSEGLG